MKPNPLNLLEVCVHAFSDGKPIKRRGQPKQPKQPRPKPPNGRVIEYVDSPSETADLMERAYGLKEARRRAQRSHALSERKGWDLTAHWLDVVRILEARLAAQRLQAHDD